MCLSRKKSALSYLVLWALLGIPKLLQRVSSGQPIGAFSRRYVSTAAIYTAGRGGTCCLSLKTDFSSYIKLKTNLQICDWECDSLSKSDGFIVSRHASLTISRQKYILAPKTPSNCHNSILRTRLRTLNLALSLRKNVLREGQVTRSLRKRE